MRAINKTKVNMEYLTEIVIPHVLGLTFLDGLDLTVEIRMAKYFEITRELTVLGKLSVPSYNSEKCVDSLVEWDQHDRKYKVNGGVLRQWKRKP